MTAARSARPTSASPTARSPRLRARGPPPPASSTRKIRRFGSSTRRRFVIELREPFADWRELLRSRPPAPRAGGRGHDGDLAQPDRQPEDRPADRQRPLPRQPARAGRQLILIRNPRYWGPHTAHLDRQIFALPTFDPADPLGPLRRNEIDFTATPPGFPAPLTAELAARPPDPGLARRRLAVPREGAPGIPGRPRRPSGAPEQARPAGAGVRDRPRRRSPAASMRISGRARGRSTARSFSPTSRYYRPNWSVYRYDPARARRLLEQAGCRRGADGIYSCAGERLRLRFFTTAGVADRELALQLMQTQLRQAGVEVDPVYAPRLALFGTILPGGDFDAALFSLGRESGRQRHARDEVRGSAELGRLLQPARRCATSSRWTGSRSGAPRPRARRRRPEGSCATCRSLPLFQGVSRVAIKKTIRGFVPGGGRSTSSRTARTGGSSASSTPRARASGVLERLRQVSGLSVVVGEPLEVLVE